MANYFIYVPISYGLAYLPLLIRDYYSIKKGTATFIDPRGMAEREQNATTYEGIKIKRSQYAHLNGMEVSPLFTASIVLSHLAQLAPEDIHYWAKLFIGSRVLYNYVYIYRNDTEAQSSLRTLLWFVGIGVSYTLLIKSAYAQL